MGTAASPLGCAGREQLCLDISPEPVHAVPVFGISVQQHRQRALGGRQGERRQLRQGRRVKSIAKPRKLGPNMSAPSVSIPESQLKPVFCRSLDLYMLGYCSMLSKKKKNKSVSVSSWTKFRAQLGHPRAWQCLMSAVPFQWRGSPQASPNWPPSGVWVPAALCEMLCKWSMG